MYRYVHGLCMACAWPVRGACAARACRVRIQHVRECGVRVLQAGIIGSFPALNARPKDLLDEWLTKIKADLAEHSAAHPDRPAAPFAVNQIVHGSNKRLMHDLEMCAKHEAATLGAEGCNPR